MSIDALRAIQSLLPDVEIVQSDAPADDSYAGAYSEKPRIASAECVEGRTLRAHWVVGEPKVRFAGFLDGIQRVRIECHRNGVPIVLGTVAAAVRVRVDRRFTTWGHRTPVISRRLYMPLALLQCEDRTEIDGFEIVDTSYVDDAKTLVSRHPGALRAVAFERVGRDRDEAERKLAELWCAEGAEPLFIDGGISGSGRVASASCAVGVIKSHQTLFADGDALDVVMSLRRGERSSVFAPPSQRRHPVISWYLRLRDPRGHDAMFGLIRIEASLGGDVAARANEISRWVLAEIAPLSLPDTRWDRMAYGIRDCEQFLRAIA
ncbi:MAG TPA: hypothetical protein VII66_09825 [Gemmatimonadaceae bacterium]